MNRPRSPAAGRQIIRERTGRRWVGIYRVPTRRFAISLGADQPDRPPRLSIEHGLTGADIRPAASVLANDVASDARYLTNQATTGSELIVPIVADGQVAGTLDVEDATTNAFDENAQVLLEDIATAPVELSSRASSLSSAGLTRRYLTVSFQ